MEEGVPVGTGPLAQQMGRTLVPLSPTPSPGANCNSASVPGASSLEIASLWASTLQRMGLATGALPYAEQVPLGAAYTSQSREATESTSDGEYTHLDPPAAGWAKRERERARSKGKTERTEQEWVHLSRASNSTEGRPWVAVAPESSSWQFYWTKDAEDVR